MLRIECNRIIWIREVFCHGFFSRKCPSARQIRILWGITSKKSLYKQSEVYCWEFILFFHYYYKMTFSFCWVSNLINVEVRIAHTNFFLRKFNNMMKNYWKINDRKVRFLKTKESLMKKYFYSFIILYMICWNVLF